DDWFHPEHLSSLVRTLQSRPEAQVAYSAVEAIDASDPAKPERRHVFNAPFDPVALLSENYIPLIGGLFERTLVDTGARFDEGLPSFEDWDFLLWLSRRSPFVTTSAITASYRWPPGSGVNQPHNTDEMRRYILLKWRDQWSPDEHVRLMQMAAAQRV